MISRFQNLLSKCNLYHYVAEARTRGYEIATDAGSMKAVAASLGNPARAAAAAVAPPRMLGLFAPSHLPYEIDLHGELETVLPTK
jgi:alkaline phosphatase